MNIEFAHSDNPNRRRCFNIFLVLGALFSFFQEIWKNVGVKNWRFRKSNQLPEKDFGILKKWRKILSFYGGIQKKFPNLLFGYLNKF